MKLLPRIDHLDPETVQAIVDLAFVQLTLEMLCEDSDWNSVIKRPRDCASAGTLRELLARARRRGIQPDESAERIQEFAQGIANGIYLKEPIA